MNADLKWENLFIQLVMHIYTNHFEQVEKQLAREPRPFPKLTLNPDVKSVFDFEMEDLTIEGYDPHPAIKAPVAV